MKKFLRVLAVLLAVYFLITALENILGLTSHGISFGSLALRFRRSFVSIVAAILLLVNPRKLKDGAQWFVYFAGLFAVNIWYSLAFVQGSGRAVMVYRKFPAIVSGLIILAILWGTFWMGLNERLARSKRK